MAWQKPSTSIFNKNDEGSVPDMDQTPRTQFELGGGEDVRKTYQKPGSNSDPTPGMPGA